MVMWIHQFILSWFLNVRPVEKILNLWKENAFFVILSEHHIFASRWLRKWLVIYLNERVFTIAE